MSTGKAEAKKANARADAAEAKFNTATAAAEKPNYFEEQAVAGAKAHDAWKQAKDYRTPAPGMISLGYGDPAQRQRMRERTFNIADTGLAALGGAGNATALQMAKMNMADEFDRDQSAAYERAIQAEDNFQRGGAGGWAGMDNSRRMGIASMYSSNAQNSAQLAAALRPQSLLPGLISGALGVGGAFLSGGASAAASPVFKSARPKTQQQFSDFFNKG